MPHPRGCCQVWSWMLLNVTLLGPASLGRWGLPALCRHKLPSSCFKPGQEVILLDAVAKRGCAMWGGHPVTVFAHVESTSFSFLILKPGLTRPRLAHTVVYQRLSLCPFPRTRIAGTNPHTPSFHCPLTFTYVPRHTHPCVHTQTHARKCRTEIKSLIVVVYMYSLCT